MSLDAPDLKPIEAILASLRLWILDLICAIMEAFGAADPFGRALAREARTRLSEVQFDLKRAIFLLAVARLPDKPTARRFHPPPGYGVRRFRQSALRLVTHGVFNRMRPGAIRTRIGRLRDVLENVEAWVARLLKRLVRGFSGAHRVLAAPPVARAFANPAFTPPLADSS
ncbi:MAG: hypothetical protein JNJ73_04050 [Hyphomonadaceae bacterium]|nr:hypothetical protein [Hyphomonadaceae bacterium]